MSPTSTLPAGPPYRAPGNRKYYTESLFRETNPQGEIILPVFSLYQDWPGCVNCRKTFIELKDPTGYKWATTYLGDYSHWLKLVKLEWFATALDQWRGELDQLLKAEAIQKIIETASGTSQSAFQAAKFLAGLEYRKSPSNRGRPSKEEVSGELKNQMRLAQAVDEDYLRMKGLPN